MLLIEISLFGDVEFVNSSTDAVAEMISLLNVADGIFSEQIGGYLILTQATALQAHQTLTSNDSLALIRAFRNTGFPSPGWELGNIFNTRWIVSHLTASRFGVHYG
ncbi:MAG: hypothetical protein ACJA0G_001575 [Kangiellaceae bacterium]